MTNCSAPILRNGSGVRPQQILAPVVQTTGDTNAFPAERIGCVGDHVGWQEQARIDLAPPIRVRLRLLGRLADWTGDAVVRLPFVYRFAQGLFAISRWRSTCR